MAGGGLRRDLDHFLDPKQALSIISDTVIRPAATSCTKSLGIRVVQHAFWSCRTLSPTLLRYFLWPANALRFVYASWDCLGSALHGTGLLESPSCRPREDCKVCVVPLQCLGWQEDVEAACTARSLQSKETKNCGPTREAKRLPLCS